jgi:hypothetical protein
MNYLKLLKAVGIVLVGTIVGVALLAGGIFMVAQCPGIAYYLIMFVALVVLVLIVYQDLL